MTEPSQELLKSLEERLGREPQSPLFARLASYYLRAGRAKDALRLCDNGLAHYPFYSTAHLTKGKALAELGMMAEAKHEYEVVRELLPTNATAAKLWSSIDLGTPSGAQPAPAAEEPSEVFEVAAEPGPTPEPAPVAEESVVAEPPTPAVEETPREVTAQEGFAAPGEETIVQEPAAEDAFGMPVTPPVAEEEQVSAAEEPSVPAVEEPAQPMAAADVTTGSGEPPQTVGETPFGEEPAGVAPETPVDQTVAEAPPPTPEPTAAEPAATEQAEWLDAFSQLQQPTEQPVESPAPAEEENPFAAFGAEQPPAVADTESYEDFTARVRMELFGTEDTMTLDEYLSQSPSEGDPASTPDHIGDLAEKLKSSQKMTPPVINFAEKSTRSTGDVDAMGESGFVTPTLAEIYVKQGWFDDAIKAYQTLAVNKPAEKEKYQRRIAEIEEMKRSSA